jgi:hypothetical protein
MAEKTVGGVRREDSWQGTVREVPVLSAGMEPEEVAAMIAAVYGLLRLRGVPSGAAGPEPATWFERRETGGRGPSWRSRSLAASGGRGLHRA